MSRSIDEISKISTGFHTPVPTWLLVPGSFDASIAPPVQMKEQTLPLARLSFENFQRLSMRLLSVRANVSHCQEYGVAGQKQEGIDLYARVLGRSRLEVWQCKRYQKFSASDVSAAVDVFLDGKLVEESFKFVLVTTAETEEKSLADVEIAAAKKLREHNVEFALFGVNQLSVMLKAHPELIDDFFGRAWVETCCGSEVAAALADRLSGDDMAEFRAQLRNLYVAVFEQTDSFVSRAFVSVEDSAPTLTLPQRWVMPSIAYKPDSAGVLDRPASATKTDESQFSSDQTDTQNSNRLKSSGSGGSLLTEIDADSFLASTERGVILGDPGYGKSAMLRMVALDLLSDTPTLNGTASRFGNHLPVWLPFAFLSKKLSNDQSLVDAASAWLHVNGDNPNLDRLLRIAMRDNRLLLLIDGLDEWSNPDVARTAIASIQGFLSQHHVACFVTARPLGYQRLDRMSGKWRQGTLQPLSNVQQEILADRLIGYTRKDECQQTKKLETERFIRQLRCDESLGRMAGTPLLLIGLVSLWARNQALPHSRFSACEELVREMLEHHPSRRAAASVQSASLCSLSPEIRRGAMSCLALEMHKAPDGASMSRSEAESCFVSYFREIEGMSTSEARAYARQMLPISDQIIGILSEATSTGDVQFVHRTFQEFLAAEHLHSCDLEEQLNYCKKYVGDPAWHQVILFLLQHNRRPADVARLIDALEQVDLNLREQHSRKLLLAEAIFSNIRLSPELRAERAIKILDEVESGTWLPFREALLSKVLFAPPASNVYGLLMQRLDYWTPMPSGFRYDHGLCEALLGWPQGSGAEDALWALLNHESLSVQIEAARALGNRCKGEELWKARLAKRLEEPLASESLAATIIGLASGWCSDVDVVEMFRKGLRTQSPEIIIASVYGLVSAEKHDDLCKKLLLTHGQLVWFGDIIVNSALKGWPGDEDIRNAALNRVDDNCYGQNSFWPDDAWRIVIEGYPGDDAVAKVITKHLGKSHLMFDLFKSDYLIAGFKGHPLIAEAAKEWLSQEDNLKSHEAPLVEALSYISDAKNSLLERVLGKKAYGYFALKNLIDAWGDDDPDVAGVLTQVLKAPVLIHDLAVILARTSVDKAMLRKIVWDVYRNREDDSKDHVLLEALTILRAQEADGEVVDLALQRMNSREALLTDDWELTYLIDGYGDHPRVRELALKYINEIKYRWDSIATAYKDDAVIRERVVKQCKCLPSSLRYTIALHCRQRASYEPKFRNVAEMFRRECDSNTRVMGAISVAESAVSLNEDITKLTEYFSQEVAAGGVDHEERHESAVAGLIALRKASLIGSVKRWGTNPVMISLGYSYRDRNVLPLYIVKEWDAVKSAFGDKVWDAFSGNSDLEQLRRAASDLKQHQLAEEIAKVIDDRSSPEHKDLKQMARRRAHGWVDACFSAMGLDAKDVKGRSVNVQQCNDATHLLAKYASNDDAVKQRLEGFVKSKQTWSHNALHALARGWPNSATLRSVWESAISNEPNVLRHQCCLVSCFATPGRFVEWLKLWLSEMADKNRRWNLSEDRWFVMRRCFEDREVATLLLSVLQNNPNMNECASFPWFIRSNPLEDAEHSLRLWAGEMLQGEISQEWATFGFDLFKADVVSLKQTMYELLMTDFRYTLA